MYAHTHARTHARMHAISNGENIPRANATNNGATLNAFFSAKIFDVQQILWMTREVVPITDISNRSRGPLGRSESSVLEGGVVGARVRKDKVGGKEIQGIYSAAAFPVGCLNMLDR